MNNLDLKTLLIKKDNLLKEIAILENNKEKTTKDYLRIRKEVELAKNRIDLEPELKHFLEKFQRKEQEKLVGVNQNLLTAILQDVMKNDNEERKVIMDIFTERGLPALSIFIEKNEQGVLEDVYNGTGGAVANILSLGLRAIALIQSKKRRFLVLDEPDCWIKPEIIPDFVQVIKQLSEKLNIQILIISHHDESLLNGINHRLILEKENGKLKTKWSNQYGCTQPIWEEDDDGIRSIYLENFQSHSSTFIPLAKTVTLLTGLNDLGKSTVVNALRAVFYGLSDDTNIKHFENETKVSIDFGKFALFWERKLKGKPKETFILIDEQHDFSNPLHKTESARETPLWLEQETGIGLIEGFDIQLGHQKRPVFLLDEPASKKAKALSIGDESNYVQQMINLSKEDLTQAKQAVKNGEKELERRYKILRIYEKYADEFKELEEKLKVAFENSINLIEKNDELLILKEKLNKTLSEKNNLTTLLNKLNSLNNEEALQELNKSEENSNSSRFINVKAEKEELLKIIKQYKIVDKQRRLFTEHKKALEALKEKELIELNDFNKQMLFLKNIEKINYFAKLVLKKKHFTLYQKEKFLLEENLLKLLKTNNQKIQNILRIENIQELFKKLNITIKINELNQTLSSIKQEEKQAINIGSVKKEINTIKNCVNNRNLLLSNKEKENALILQINKIKEEKKTYKICPLCLQSISHHH